MANDLLESFRVASSHFKHVVFNEETRQFERAGKRHAIATFFGSADARAKNEATLKAVKQFMAIERVQEYGVSSNGGNKDYFSNIKSSGRIESAAINRIISKMRDDIAASPAAKTAAKEKILEEFLNDELSWGSFRTCLGENDDAKNMAETFARFLVNYASSAVSVADNAGLERFRNKVEQSLRLNMGKLTVFIGHNKSDAETLGALFERLRGLEIGSGDGGKCLERFMSTLFTVAGEGNEVMCDEIAVSRFLSLFDEVRDEDVGDLLSLVDDILEQGKGAGDSPIDINSCIRSVNGTLQFLRTQTERHPDALKDGVQLMRELRAPVGADVMKALLDMAGKVADGLLDAKRPFDESLDENLASICFAGNRIESAVGKDDKNWIVTRFVLASAPKVSYPAMTNMVGSAGFRQQTCGMNLFSIAGNLKAFYSRVGGPLCSQYSKAVDFLIDRYLTEHVIKWQRTDEPNAYGVAKSLIEKYDVQNRTAAKLSKYKTEISDYHEFEGTKSAQAAEAVECMDAIIGKARIFAGDKIRVKHLAMQEVAFMSKNGRFPDSVTVQGIAHRYCRMAKWGGALLDRLAEISVDGRKAVMLALEAYGCSSDPKLFGMLTRTPEVLGDLVWYVGRCVEGDKRMGVPEGTSVAAWDIHTLITGTVGIRQELDPRHNPHLDTCYSRSQT